MFGDQRVARVCQHQLSFLSVYLCTACAFVYTNALSLYEDEKVFWNWAVI